MVRFRALLLFLVAIAMACLMNTSTGATEHIVGDDYGWKIPPNASFYQEWARRRTFTVGDKLVFVHPTSAHSVMEVSTSADFEGCSELDAVGTYYYKAPAVFELTTPGPRYFYCGIGLHCEKGQKLRIEVTGADGAGDPARRRRKPPA